MLGFKLRVKILRGATVEKNDSAQPYKYVAMYDLSRKKRISGLLKIIVDVISYIRICPHGL